MASKRILSAGQCLADQGRISQTLGRGFEVEVVLADDHAEVLRRLRQDGPYALVLVNRIFDQDGSSGLDLIRKIKADGGLEQTPVMLVSNYDDAQAEAVAAGAAPGFGKAELGQQTVLKKLEPYLR